MMGTFWFVRLTYTAHGVKFDAFGDEGNRGARDGAGIGQHGFRMTRPNQQVDRALRCGNICPQVTPPRQDDHCR